MAKKRKARGKRTVNIAFDEHGNFKGVFLGRTKVAPGRAPIRDITLERVRTVGLAFTGMEPKSPGRCCVWMGGIPYCWSC